MRTAAACLLRYVSCFPNSCSKEDKKGKVKEKAELAVLKQGQVEQWQQL